MRTRLVLTCLFVTLRLCGDGGTVQFRKQAGPLLITVFSAPTPLRAGVADFTVLVQNSHDTGVVLDAEVVLTLSKVDASDISVPATHAQATNKLLYAAHPVLPAAGDWRLIVSVKSQGTAVSVDGVITVMPTQPSIMAYWLYIAMAPAGILFFVVNQWLKSRSHHSGKSRV